MVEIVVELWEAGWEQPGSVSMLRCWMRNEVRSRILTAVAVVILTSPFQKHCSSWSILASRYTGARDWGVM